MFSQKKAVRTINQKTKSNIQKFSVRSSIKKMRNCVEAETVRLIPLENLFFPDLRQKQKIS